MTTQKELLATDPAIVDDATLDALLAGGALNLADTVWRELFDRLYFHRVAAARSAVLAAQGVFARHRNDIKASPGGSIDVIGERARAARDELRVFVHGCQYLTALLAAADATSPRDVANGMNRLPALPNMLARRPSPPWKPYGPVFDIEAWVSERASVLLDGNRVRIIDGKLCARDDVFTDAEMDVLRRHEGHVMAFIEGVVFAPIQLPPGMPSMTERLLAAAAR